MASLAHCIYCFEILVASLEDRDALSLAQIEQLWAEYTAEPATQDVDEGVGSNTTLAPQPTRGLLSASSSGSGSSSSSTPSTPSTQPDSAHSGTSSRTSLSSAQAQSTLAARLRSRRSEKYPVFVTWNIVSRNSKNLRGCIGTFDAQPLESVLRTYALTSAFEDTRFHPISSPELPSLECSVTLLTDFEPAPGPMDWELGTHGLRIAFTSHGRRLGATYLPDVPREQGWSKEETMVSLMRKAGWSGRREDWMDVPDLAVTRYQGSRQGLGYNDWKAFRSWVAGRETA